MQNTVYERKQNGEDFFSLLSVTCSCSGNCPANGLVTEQPQYYVVICIFSIWKNTETMLISNGLRLIFFCLLFLAQPITFHTARHTHATMMLTLGVDLYTVSKLLGHTNIQTTQIYAKLVDESKKKAIDLIPNISQGLVKCEVQFVILFNSCRYFFYLSFLQR